MKKKRITFSCGCFLIIVVLIGFAVFYSQQEKKSASPKYPSASSPLPAIFGHSSEDIKGISTSLNSAWNLYTNKTLGISLEYPARRFGYGVLTTGEKKDLKSVYDPYAAGDPFYEIVFSDGDSSFYVVIAPSRSSDIDMWLATQGQEYQSSSYSIRQKVIDGKKAIVIRHTPIIESSKEEDIREHLILIRDGVLYDVDISHLKNAERERIFDSFRVF